MHLCTCGVVLFRCVFFFFLNIICCLLTSKHSMEMCFYCNLKKKVYQKQKKSREYGKVRSLESNIAREMGRSEKDHHFLVSAYMKNGNFRCATISSPIHIRLDRAKKKVSSLISLANINWFPFFFVFFSAVDNRFFLCFRSYAFDLQSLSIR